MCVDVDQLANGEPVGGVLRRDGSVGGHVESLRVHDVRRASGGGGSVVVATRGLRKQEILCRRPCEGVLASAADRVDTAGTARYLFRPICGSRGTNTITNFLARTQPNPNVPRLVMGCLRSIWLVGLFEERLPITVIVAAAGGCRRCFRA